MNAVTPFQHQAEIAQFIEQNHRALVLADPGTGKTFAVLLAIKALGMRAVVACPKSIMVPAWVRDCQKFTPELSITVAEAPPHKRLAAFTSGADIVVINHDGVKWLSDNSQLLDGQPGERPFQFLAIDESTAYKNKDSQRSRAIAHLATRFTARVGMTGTPIANGLLNLWHQAYLIDSGECLGGRFYAFRAATHTPIPSGGGFHEWVMRDGAIEAVADMIAPIALRYAIEDCIDIPEHNTIIHTVSLSKALRKHYDALKRDAILEIQQGQVTALNAGVMRTKLLQIASGAVYNAEETYKLATERYDLVAELVTERAHPCLIGFQWKHQRDGVIAGLNKAGIDNHEIAILDGDHNKNIDDIVEAFQDGRYRVLLGHPQTIGHGLTLTAAKTVIWPSPISDAELYEQLNRRIYRNTQTEKTENILIMAEDTHDEREVARLTGKIDLQTTALDLVRMLMPSPQAA